MRVEEAYSKFKSAHSDLNILSCYEYESCFVFNTSYSADTGDGLENMPLDTLYAVQKSDGVIHPFNPFDISEEEYNSGKKIDVNSEFKTDNPYKKQMEAARAWINSLDVNH